MAKVKKCNGKGNTTMKSNVKKSNVKKGNVNARTAKSTHTNNNDDDLANTNDNDNVADINDNLANDGFVQKVRSRLFDGKYCLVRKLGQGGFSLVYLAQHFESGFEIALKLEHTSAWPPFFQTETSIYEAFSGVEGFPELYSFGKHEDYNFMAFELLGPNLEDLFVFCGCRFSLKTTLLILDQLLPRLETLHSSNVLHRDIKPENCLLGCGENGNVVYLTDFGLAREYNPERERERREEPTSPRLSLLGTAKFASLRAHYGRAQSPADDLESLGYMMVYFIKGRLPWQGLHRSSDEEWEEAVVEKKSGMSVEELCEGLPPEFAEFIKYVKSLPRGGTVDYTMLRKSFQRLAQAKQIEYDNVFDWTERLFWESEEAS